MSDKACKQCGKPISFIQNWLGHWVVLEVVPQEYQKKSYVEVRREEFVPVIRHECK